MIYVILFIVIGYVIYFFINASSINASKVCDYYERLPELPYDILYMIKDLMRSSNGGLAIMPDDIRSESDFHNSFDALVSAIYDADRRRNVAMVNMLAIFMVKYYAIYINRYGTMTEKSIFGNNVRLLKMNKVL